jgi:hypothetical protein
LQRDLAGVSAPVAADDDGFAVSEHAAEAIGSEEEPPRVLGVG